MAIRLGVVSSKMPFSYSSMALSYCIQAKTVPASKIRAKSQSQTLRRAIKPGLRSMVLGAVLEGGAGVAVMVFIQTSEAVGAVVGAGAPSSWWFNCANSRSISISLRLHDMAMVAWVFWAASA